MSMRETADAAAPRHDDLRRLWRRDAFGEDICDQKKQWNGCDG